MNKHFRIGVVLMAFSLAGWSQLAAAESVTAERKTIDVPVYEGGVRRSYIVIGQIKDNLRKHFAFQPAPTKAEIFAEIWERAEKMGADAVIDARFGPTKATLFDHGRTPISGTAIKFTD